MLLLAAIFFLCIQTCQSIQCYVCNSEYNVTCEDPFDPDVNQVFLKNCNEQGKKETPTLCRKATIQVKDHTRIKRSCGWISHNRECYVTGKEQYRTYVCSCTEDGCNDANSKQAFISLTMLPMFVKKFI